MKFQSTSEKIESHVDENKVECMDCSVYKAVRFMESQRKTFIFKHKFDSFIYKDSFII